MTNLRAIVADKLRNGDWKFTDYPLASLVSSKQTALLRSLIMKFKIINSTRTLKFLYLGNGSPALAALSAPSDAPVLDENSHNFVGEVLRQSEAAPQAGTDI